MKKLRTAGLMLILMMLLSAAQPTLFAEDATQKTKLPKVLIIGDSISIGYTAHVIKALEGIEKLDIVGALQSINCTWGQGYFFAKPMSVADVEVYVKNEQEKRGPRRHLEKT